MLSDLGHIPDNDILILVLLLAFKEKIVILLWLMLVFMYWWVVRDNVFFPGCFSVTK